MKSSFSVKHLLQVPVGTGELCRAIRIDGEIPNLGFLGSDERFKLGKGDLVDEPVRVRLRIGSMADATQEKASHCDMDHRLGDINALYIIAHEAPPLNEPSEGSLDHPASRQYLEALFPLDTPDNFDDELQECGLVLGGGVLVGPPSREGFLAPPPPLANGDWGRPRPPPVGDIGRGQINHQQAPVGVHRHVSLAPYGLLAAVKSRAWLRARRPSPSDCRERHPRDWPRDRSARGLPSVPRRGWCENNINRTKRRNHQ